MGTTKWGVRRVVLPWVPWIPWLTRVERKGRNHPVMRSVCTGSTRVARSVGM